MGLAQIALSSVRSARRPTTCVTWKKPACTQSVPAGGLTAWVGMQGSMKPLGRAIIMVFLNGSPAPYASY
jgi:hypothetical protein